MTSFLTGASGFVGQHLLKALDSRKESYITIPHEEIENYPLSYFENYYYLSSYGNLITQDSTRETIKANTLDLITTIEKCANIKFNSFVYISTSSVLLPKQTLYSRCKKASEEILLAFIEKYDAKITILRPFSVCGLGDNPIHLIPTLIRSCLTGERVNFDPKPSHDFIDVDDLVAGILNLQGKKGVYELGNGKSYSNMDVLAIVEKVTGKIANVHFVDNLRVYDTNNWVCKNKAAREWGWKPKKSLEQSILEQFNYMKEAIR